MNNISETRSQTSNILVGSDNTYLRTFLNFAVVFYLLHCIWQIVYTENFNHFVEIKLVSNFACLMVTSLIITKFKDLNLWLLTLIITAGMLSIFFAKSLLGDPSTRAFMYPLFAFLLFMSLPLFAATKEKKYSPQSTKVVSLSIISTIIFILLLCPYFEQFHTSHTLFSDSYTTFVDLSVVSLTILLNCYFAMENKTIMPIQLVTFFTPVIFFLYLSQSLSWNFFIKTPVSEVSSLIISIIIFSASIIFYTKNKALYNKNTIYALANTGAIFSAYCLYSASKAIFNLEFFYSITNVKIISSSLIVFALVARHYVNKSKLNQSANNCLTYFCNAILISGLLIFTYNKISIETIPTDASIISILIPTLICVYVLYNDFFIRYLISTYSLLLTFALIMSHKFVFSIDFELSLCFLVLTQALFSLVLFKLKDKSNNLTLPTLYGILTSFVVQLFILTKINSITSIIGKLCINKFNKWLDESAVNLCDIAYTFHLPNFKNYLSFANIVIAIILSLTVAYALIRLTKTDNSIKKNLIYLCTLAISFFSQSYFLILLLLAIVWAATKKHIIMFFSLIVASSYLFVFLHLLVTYKVKIPDLFSSVMIVCLIYALKYITFSYFPKNNYNNLNNILLPTAITDKTYLQAFSLPLFFCISVSLFGYFCLDLGFVGLFQVIGEIFSIIMEILFRVK